MAQGADDDSKSGSQRMTRRPYSDSTYDALAEGRRRAEEIPAGELIEDHRAAYRADLMLPRLHVRDGESGIGPPYSEPFRRFIDWDDRNQADGVRPSSPGIAFPWSAAFYAQWAECRRSHPEHHDRPEWRGSLCYQLISWTVRHACSLESTCLILGVTVPRAGRTLRNALLWVEARIDQQQQRQEQRERDKERPAYKVYEPPEPSQERHDQPGIHAETCPKCIRKRGEAA